MNVESVAVANPRAETEAFRESIEAAVRAVLDRGLYVLGPEVESFEREFAEFTGVEHCIGVANGTDALALALRAVGVREGDEVITVSHSAVATVAAIEQIGALPVLADIDPVTRCLGPETLESLLSPKTAAIVPVHIYGQPADMVSIVAIAQKHGVSVVEDCAQAHGAEIAGRKVGSFGDAAAFSFYPTKNLAALGDGGAVVTGSARLAERLRMLRQYGWRSRYISEISGVNSRLDELQAAILRMKLRCLEANNARRREIATAYRASLRQSSIQAPTEVPGTMHAMHLFVVVLDGRERFAEFLNERAIQTAVHYPKAIHQQPAYEGRLRGSDRLPATEKLYQGIVSLPMHAYLTASEVDRVCQALCDWSAGERHP